MSFRLLWYPDTAVNKQTLILSERLQKCMPILVPFTRNYSRYKYWYLFVSFWINPIFSIFRISIFGGLKLVLRFFFFFIRYFMFILWISCRGIKFAWNCHLARLLTAVSAPYQPIFRNQWKTGTHTGQWSYSVYGWSWVERQDCRSMHYDLK